MRKEPLKNILLSVNFDASMVGGGGGVRVGGWGWNWTSEIQVLLPILFLKDIMDD